MGDPLVGYRTGTAKVSILTGRSKIFGELKNAESIVLAYDGVNPLPPSFCYLKPYYLDPDMSYFEQLAEGRL